MPSEPPSMSGKPAPARVFIIQYILRLLRHFSLQRAQRSAVLAAFDDAAAWMIGTAAVRAETAPATRLGHGAGVASLRATGRRRATLDRHHHTVMAKPT